MGIANVEKLPISPIWHSIHSWLDVKGNSSDNTKMAYTKDIVDFFQYTRWKTLEQLQPQDLLYEYKDIEGYQMYLTESNANTTVNRKIAAIKSLFRRLKRDYPEINIASFEVERLKENTKDSQVHSYGTLTMDEVFKMAKAIENDKYKGYEKSMLFLLAAGTSFRIEELFSLTWDNFEQVDDRIYIVKAVTKGGKERKSPIASRFYEQLIQLKEENGEKVFTIDKKTANSAVKKACYLCDIDNEKRNITFHSFRKVGGDFVYKRSGGDIKVAKAQTGHKSMQILVDRYMSQDVDFNQLAGVLMFDELDMGILDKVSKEDLIQVIMQCDMTTKIEIINKLKKKKG